MFDKSKQAERSENKKMQYIYILQRGKLLFSEKRSQIW